jgi:SAM-dependent methyltransferase
VTPTFSFIRRIWKKKIPDLSKNYMQPEIAAKQRELVDQQLRLMYQGEAPPHFLVLKEMFQEIVHSNREPQEPYSLLDAGCASGYYSEILRYLVATPFRYTGCDFNPAMLGMAQKKYPHSLLARMDLRKLAFKDQSFDIILSGAVIVHIKQWQDAVSEMARISKNWIILHRTLIQEQKSTEIRAERHYDVEVYRVYLQEAELIDLLKSLNYEMVRKQHCDEGAMGPGVGNYTYLFRRNG